MRAISLSFTLAGGWLFSGLSASAQMIPDATVNTIVTPSGSTFTIDGGTTAGTNLFHSFSEFSLPTGSEAFFNNAASIDNILSRVTGGSISNIDGLIRANGGANLFLLNPNGIVFGPNGSLDIGGSFISTSAETLDFADGIEFSATDTTTAPLLSVNVPVGLQFGQTPGNIVDRAVMLEVPSDNTLALIGGNVNIENATLFAPSGRIEIGSVGESQTVNLTPDPDGFAFTYTQNGNFQNIELSGETVINASGSPSGPIHLRAQNIQILPGAVVFSLNSSSQSGDNIVLEATDSIELTGTGNFLPEFFSLFSNDFNDPLTLPAGIYTTTDGTGASGNVEVNAATVNVAESAYIFTTSLLGRAGDVEVNASESVSLRTTQLGSLNRSASIDGPGDMIVNTARLRLEEAGTLGVSTSSTAPGGDIIVNASESVEIVGTEFIPFTLPNGTADILVSAFFVDTFDFQGRSGDGDSGNIIVNTDCLTVLNGGTLGAASRSEGAAGNIEVTARSIELVGRSIEEEAIFPSSITTVSFADAVDTSGGQIVVTAEDIRIADGAELFVTNFAPGNSNNITVNAQSIRLENGGSINAETAFGDGGNIDIDANILSAFGGSEIRARSGTAIRRDTSGQGQPGNGGNISIEARQSLITGGSRIFAIADDPLNTSVLLTGSNISIDSNVLRVRGGSSILASHLTLGDGGNVNISANRVLLNDGSISTETALGEGGNIDIETRNTRLLNGSQINTVVGRATDPVSGLDVVGMGGDGGNISIDTNALIAFGNSDIFTDVLSGDGGQIDIDANAIVGAEFREGLTPFSDIATISTFDEGDSIVLSCPGDREMQVASKTSAFAQRPRSGIALSFPLEEATDWFVNDDGTVTLVANRSTSASSTCESLP